MGDPIGGRRLSAQDQELVRYGNAERIFPEGSVKCEGKIVISNFKLYKNDEGGKKGR
jgi:hypothetical protein